MPQMRFWKCTPGFCPVAYAPPRGSDVYPVCDLGHQERTLRLQKALGKLRALVLVSWESWIVADSLCRSITWFTDMGLAGICGQLLSPELLDHWHTRACILSKPLFAVRLSCLEKSLSINTFYLTGQIMPASFQDGLWLQGANESQVQSLPATPGHQDEQDG